MDYYNNSQLLNFWENKFHFLNLNEENGVFTLILDRANKKNALHPQMINEIAFCFSYISTNDKIRVVIIRSTGDTFSSGRYIKF